MLIHPERGFIMGFFNAPEIERLDMQQIQSCVPGSQCDRFNDSNSYRGEVLVHPNSRIILMTCVHADGHTLIHSEFRPLELSLLLKNAPQEMRKTINGALKGHLPDLSPLSEAWLLSNNEAETFQASMRIIETLSTLQASETADFTAQEAFDIMQAEYGITRHDADRPVLASRYAGPCVILSLYNEKARQGFLSHIDDGMDLNQISSCIFKMRKNASERLIANMAGGWSDTYHMVANITLRLEEQPNIIIAGWKEPDNIVSNLALDSRDGKLYETFNLEQIDAGPLVEERSLRIMKSFKGQPRPALLSYHYKTGRDTAMAYAR
ncbi:MAG: hypothetical protein R3E13_00400 [Alphaproteobacteria bacterium]